MYEPQTSIRSSTVLTTQLVFGVESNWALMLGHQIQDITSRSKCPILGMDGRGRAAIIPHGISYRLQSSYQPWIRTTLTSIWLIQTPRSIFLTKIMKQNQYLLVIIAKDLQPRDSIHKLIPSNHWKQIQPILSLTCCSVYS